MRSKFWIAVIGVLTLVSLLLVLPACTTTLTPPEMDNDDAGVPLSVLTALPEKLTASDAADGDLFGYSVSVSGDTAVIGAPRDDWDLGEIPWSDTGSVYVFEKSATGWTEAAKLNAPEAGGLPDGEEYFGYSVSVDGDTAVIGEPYHGPFFEADGLAYVFEKSATGWTEAAILFARGDPYVWEFGVSVSVSGDTAVIGAPGSTLSSLAGAAYVFVRSDGVWNWQEQAKLAPPIGDALPWYRFGQSVSVSGDTAVIGMPSSDAGPGAAYVFVRSDEGWTQRAKLTASDTAGFGQSVSVSGDTAVIGASGAAYVFVRSDEGWTQRAKLTASDTAGFGQSVSVSGDTAVIGAGGAAYVFWFDGATWTQQEKLIASDTAGFGRSVLVSGDTAVIGAPFDDGAGSAYVFDLDLRTRSIRALIAKVETLVADGTLKPGQGRGLINPLRNAIRSLEKDKPADACNQLQDFIDEVNAKTPTPLDPDTAGDLINDATNIRLALGCAGLF